MLTHCPPLTRAQCISPQMIILRVVRGRALSPHTDPSSDLSSTEGLSDDRGAEECAQFTSIVSLTVSVASSALPPPPEDSEHVEVV